MRLTDRGHRCTVSGPAQGWVVRARIGPMSFHHVELGVTDFAAARPRWARLLGELGWPVLAQ